MRMFSLAAHQKRLLLSLVVLTLAMAALVLPASAIAAEANDDPSTASALPASPFSEQVGSADAKDFYRIDSSGGEYLRLELSSADGYSDVDLKLYVGVSQNEFDVIVTSKNRDTSSERIELLLPPGGGPYTLEVLTAYPPPGETWNYTLKHSLSTELTPRLSGNDRYLTSYAISRSSFATASACVVASGRGFPDALAASGLAGEIRGPILLTDPLNANQGLIDEIRRLGVRTVYIVGGSAAVNPAVDAALKPYVTEVLRVKGDNRYETSYRVAQKIAQLRGVSTLSHAFVVRGDSFADALAVAPFAFREAVPVLLTKSTSLDGYASSAIRNYDIDNVYIAGGTAAVGSPVEAAIKALAPPVDKVERWYGINRYATAVDVAQEGISEFGWTNAWESIGIATGVSYPDALSGGVTCGLYGGPLLLTDSKVLSSECRSAVYAHRNNIDMMVLFGGTVAVSDSVRTSLRSLIP